MKTYWKWIIGIVIALAVVAVAMIGMRYLISNGAIPLPANLTTWHGPMMGRDFDGPRGSDDNGNNGQGRGNGWGNGFNGPKGDRRNGFGHFGPLVFLGGLVRLAFFGALLYGAYWLGKRNARVTLDPAPVAPPVEPDATPKRGRKVAKS
jgi:hypothetical protein